MRPLFIATVFVNAALLFAVQPMFARLVLPLLGGVPAVWNTALVFFQAALLAGYAYAWAVSARLPLKLQLPVHLAVMAVPLALLPIALPAGWAPPAAGSPVAWQLMLMVATVGLPFFALATNATLLQHWLSRSRDAAAGDPYFLYSASNLGSAAALIAYPAAIAPLLGLALQGVAWSAGYGLLVLLLAAAAWRTWQRRADAGDAETPLPPAAAATDIRWRHRLAWTALAFVPSSLLLGVTAHVSAEVTVAPLLWVVPLTLYLLTFVNAFARRPWIPQRAAVALQAWAAIVLAATFFLRVESIALVFVVHLAAFFLACLVCHGELAARRPGVAGLPEFYLWLALGGALGGAFNALAAPLLFTAVLEYPLALVLACALRPALDGAGAGADNARRARRGDLLYPAALAVGLYVGLLALDRVGWVAGLAALGLGGLACYAMRARPHRFALAIAALLAFGAAAVTATSDVVERQRSFFGVHKVLRDRAHDAYQLVHGVTVHGTQLRAPEMRRTPVDYYHWEGPLGQLFRALAEDGQPGRVALVGLGAGASLCYRRPGDAWRVYEIDPAVVALARDTRFFHFVAECGGDAEIVLGDGRLGLARPGTGPFDLIILDAFASDAVPAHLLTAEAMALYRRLLAPGGLIAAHVTNRFMDLAPVVAAAAEAAGMAAVEQFHAPTPPTLAKASRWVVVAADAGRLDAVAAGGRWKKLAASSPPWTDDHWDILAAIRWGGSDPAAGRR